MVGEVVKCGLSPPCFSGVLGGHEGLPVEAKKLSTVAGNCPSFNLRLIFFFHFSGLERM